MVPRPAVPTEGGEASPWDAQGWCCPASALQAESLAGFMLEYRMKRSPFRLCMQRQTGGHFPFPILQRPECLRALRHPGLQNAHRVLLCLPWEVTPIGVNAEFRAAFPLLNAVITSEIAGVKIKNYFYFYQAAGTGTMCHLYGAAAQIH